MPSTAGSNLPAFQAVQLDFAAHIRDPVNNPAPPGIEPRRMRIYAELFYNNIESFLRRTFPVSREVVGEDRWHALVRDFMVRHRATSPYFHEIPQEFLEHLGRHAELIADLPFLIELAHYEWVELALDVSVDEIPQAGIDPEGDLLEGVPVLSPLAWPLCYRYPVHRITPDRQPGAPASEPVHLIVHRNRDEEVKFMESNAVTARLLALLNGDGSATGRAVLARIASELAWDPATLVEHGRRILDTLRRCDIILGTRS